MYQVLYRKWRPKAFAEVTGQQHVTKTLLHELQSDRIAHAYLFTGSRGTGKTTCAKILAKAVNCLHPVNGDPCNQCEICTGIDDGSILDVVEIDAASNNGVDNIRDLREEATFTPTAAKYRVYIIDEVHMLSIGAFNALLKTLEEPPAHVLFILATTEVHKLPATILSRCQRFDFKRIAPEDMSKRLHYVAQQEGIDLTEDGAMLISRIADGALRDALSLLDQCAGQGGRVDEKAVTAAAGLAGREHLFILSKAVRTNDVPLALEVVDQLHSASRDMARVCEELINHYRHLMLIRSMEDASRYIVCSSQELDQLKEEASQYTMPAILHALSVLGRVLDHMPSVANRRVEMETALVRLCNPQLDGSNEALVRRMEKLESAMRSGRLTPSTQTSGTAVSHQPEAQKEHLESETAAENNMHQPVEETTAVPTKKKPSQQAVQPVPLTCWPEVLSELSQTAKPLHGVLDGSAAYEAGNRILIDAPNPLAKILINEAEHRDALRQAIQNQTGRRYGLGPYRREENSDHQDPMAALEKKLDALGIPMDKK
ncbi:DNA polymerase III subunit gamma/tau [Solibaculum mannosilyticum]|uniref:DNA polymerase III subunit gamma/tau n=1 Tax=Solibaculum mannosilyticum TaxID=2780922 RepID=UPI0034C4D99D